MAHFVQDYPNKIAAGDWVGAAEYYADDIVSHQSGHSKWSGTFTAGRRCWTGWAACRPSSTR